MQKRHKMIHICKTALVQLLQQSHTHTHTHIPVDPQLRSPAADTVLWCCSPAILDCQRLRMRLATARARTCVAAMTGVSGVLLSASTHSHVAVQSRHTCVLMPSSWLTTQNIVVTIYRTCFNVQKAIGCICLFHVIL